MTTADTTAEISSVLATIDKHRGGLADELGAALAVVALSAERVDREVALRDDLMRVAHQSGASLRQIAEAAGLGRKTVTAIIAAGVADR